MFKFLSRQFKTKTGKFGLSMILGTVANSIFGDPATANTVLSVANEVLTPSSGLLGMAAMFLRDGAAKQGE